MPESELTSRAAQAFDSMCELEPNVTHPEWNAIKYAASERIIAVLSAKDCEYLPDFKWMDFVSASATLTRSIAQETQLRKHEAIGLLRNLLSEETESVKRLYLEAALERARYEPMMVLPKHIKLYGSERRATLHRRWKRMCEAQQAHHPIDATYLDEATRSVERAIASKEFRHYRIGPLLQLFAEILHAARAASIEKIAPVKLRRTLAANGKIWRSYILKAKRYSKATPSIGAASQQTSHHTMH